MRVVVPKYPKKWGKLKPLPLRESYADTDKDLFPNNVDCNHLDSKKQGPLSWAISKVQKKPYEEVEKERYAASSRRHAVKHGYRMQRIEEQRAELEARQPIYQAKEASERTKMSLQRERMNISEKRTALMAKRQRSMPTMPSMFGSSTSATPVKMPSLSEAFGMKPSMPAPTLGGTTSASKKRKKRRKGKKGKSMRGR